VNYAPAAAYIRFVVEKIVRGGKRQIDLSLVLVGDNQPAEGGSLVADLPRLFLLRGCGQLRVVQVRSEGCITTYRLA